MKCAVKFASAAFCALSAAGVSGAVLTNTIVNGASDWTDPRSFTDTSYAPGDSGEHEYVVIIPENATVRLNASTDAGSLERVQSLRQVLLASTSSRFEINVESDDEVAIPVSISGYKFVPYIDYQCGPVVKIGTGTLHLSSSGFFGSTTAAHDYYTSMVASQGVLKVQQDMPHKSSYLGRVTVEEGAVFRMPYSSGSESICVLKSLSGDGTVTNAAGKTVQLTFAGLKSYEDDAEFGGVLAGDVKLHVDDSDAQRLTGDLSTFKSVDVRISDSRNICSWLGVNSFGSGKGTTSSLGMMEGGGAPLLYFDSYGGGVEYLGSGGTCARGFVFQTPTDTVYHPAIVSGGAHGGITFTGHWQRQWTTTGGQNLVLTGSNTVACVLANVISDNTTSESEKGRGHTLYLRKEGSGTWLMKDISSRTAFASGISVDDGVLQYDSLAEAGEVCALGMATNLTDGTMGTADTNAEHRMDYAVRLGGPTLSGENRSGGRLEYVGETMGATASRSIAVAGAGGLRQNGTAQVVYAGGVYGLSEGDMTLYLDGTNTAENIVCNVSDGAAGGSLSVVKEGSGRWVLGGSLTFTGDIDVRGGTLEISRPTRYGWYRWTVTSLYPLNALPPHATWPKGTSDSSNVQFVELGFFDAAGSNLVAGVEVDDDNTVSTGYVDLRKGTAQIQTIAGTLYCIESSVTVGGVSSNVMLTLDRAFDNTYTGWGTHGVRYDLVASDGRHLRPVQDDPETWFPVTIRLPEGTNEVVGVDFANASGGWSGSWNSCISNFMVEASMDGIHWTVLTNVEAAAVHYDGGMWSCQGGYTDGEDSHNTRFPNSFPDGTPHYKWYPLCGRPASLPVVTAPAGSVSVSGGGMLRFVTDGDASMTLSDVRVDAASGGAIEGFTFAENGSLTVLNAPENGTVNIPVEVDGSEGAENLSSWSVIVNGAPSARRKPAVVGGRLVLRPVGTVLVVR